MSESDDKKELDNIIGPPGQSAAEGVASARERFQRLGDEIQERYRKVSEDVRRGAERASQEIRRGEERVGEEAAEDAWEKYDRVRSQVGSLSREINLYVRDNPGKSLLIAAGVGLLLGFLVRGRGGSRE